jgi:16S rRNA (cytosine1402-N4)-methyltransferase
MTTQSTPNRFSHTPVMLTEVVELFGVVPAGVLVDATVGAGGHAQALLSSRDDLDLVGLDRDVQALAAATRTLEPFGERVTLRHARFDHLGEELASLGIAEVVGVLFDLGVSSPQLDVDERGFSYHRRGPLDMRMDATQSTTAAHVVNEYPEEDLVRILHTYGDERYAKRIAREIVRRRPLSTTAELADAVRDAVPAAARRAGHPARRTFQAIRIEVNSELDVLPLALDQAIDALVPLGRCAVLSYHSGEDRIVKEQFRAAAGEREPAPPRGLPVEPTIRARVRLMGRRARKPRAEEIVANPRAESARLRAVEKLASTSADTVQTKMVRG